MKLRDGDRGFTELETQKNRKECKRHREIGRQGESKRECMGEREKERQRARETSRDIEMSDVDVDVARESRI